MNRFFARLAAVFAVMAATVTGAAVPAHAADANIVRYDLFLGGTDSSSHGTVTLRSEPRRIFLTKDDYTWINRWARAGGGTHENSRYILLASDYYYWNCVAIPETYDKGLYATYCALRRESTGVVVYTPTFYVDPDGQTHNGVEYGEWFDWYSILVRHYHY